MQKCNQCACKKSNEWQLFLSAKQGPQGPQIPNQQPQITQPAIPAVEHSSQTGKACTMIPLALFPKALARVMYSDLVIVDLGLPRNSRMLSKGSATSPAPQNTMNNSQPAPTLHNCDTIRVSTMMATLWLLDMKGVLLHQPGKWHLTPHEPGQQRPEHMLLSDMSCILC